mgnify:CR=1 FL=1
MKQPHLIRKRQNTALPLIYRGQFYLTTMPFNLKDERFKAVNGYFENWAVSLAVLLRLSLKVLIKMTEKQLRFIELYSFQKKNYPEIEKIMNISREDVSNLRRNKSVNGKIQSIQNIYTKFTGKRKEAFKHDFRKFYDWYEGQDQKCGYCDVTQEQLYTLFNPERRILPYLESGREYKKAPKRSSGTLEIERLDSSNSYNNENIILACPLCNNAKSNLIDEESWRELFVPAMKQYYKKLLDSNI